MKKTLLTLATVATLACTSVQATPIRLDGSETNLQQIINGLGGAGIDVATDQVALDETFRIDGFRGFAEIVVEIAGHANLNRFGIYSVTDPGSRVELFNGAASSGALKSFTTSLFTDDIFGFYLETPDGVWFSQSRLNADGADHSVAYQYGSQYVLGWEDLSSSRWDQDYNDFVVLISGVKGVEVPEPTSLALFGLGLAGAAVFGRRRRKS